MTQIGTAIATPRRAATVMLVRDEPFEVLMVKRNAREPFASALVFPGGVVEPEDYSDSWPRSCLAGGADPCRRTP
jgi:8-oxo-dGTP pyrophosphatase MutT (NUDIX family)